MLNRLLVTVDDKLKIVTIELDKEEGDKGDNQISFLSGFEALLFALCASGQYEIKITPNAIDTTLLGLQCAVQDYLELVQK